MRIWFRNIFFRFLEIYLLEIIFFGNKEISENIYKGFFRKHIAKFNLLFHIKIFIYIYIFFCKNICDKKYLEKKIKKIVVKKKRISNVS